MSDSADIPVPDLGEYVERDLQQFFAETRAAELASAAAIEAERRDVVQQNGGGGGKEKAKRARKNASSGSKEADPKIKRFLNSYSVFLDYRTADTKQAHPELKHIHEVWRYLAAEWKGMSPKEKAFYDKEYRNRKELFDLEYPDYVLSRKNSPSTSKVLNQVSPTSSFSSALEGFSPPPTPSTLTGSPPRKRYHKKRRQTDGNTGSEYVKDDWKGLKFKKKQTSSGGNEAAPSYNPIAVKAHIPQQATLFPVSRPPIQHAPAFWETPARRHNARPQNTYSRKGFFKPRPESRPRNGKYIECGYCKSLGFSGGRTNHFEQDCRTKPRSQIDSGERAGKPSSRGKPRSQGVGSSASRPPSSNRQAIPLITITKPSSSASEGYIQPVSNQRYFNAAIPTLEKDTSEIEEGEITETGQPLDASSWMDAFGDIGIPDVGGGNGMSMDDADFEAFKAIMRDAIAENDDFMAFEEPIR